MRDRARDSFAAQITRAMFQGARERRNFRPHRPGDPLWRQPASSDVRLADTNVRAPDEESNDDD